MHVTLSSGLLETITHHWDDLQLWWFLQPIIPLSHPRNLLPSGLVVFCYGIFTMLYMIIERFKSPGFTVPVYERFRQQGRLARKGLTYLSSWVTVDLKTCYQVMEAHDRRLLDEWMANWEDLVDFEVLEVITSAEANDKVGTTA